MQKEKTIIYKAMVSELDGIDVVGFPKKYPMFIMGTNIDLDKYNAAMIKAISKGFSPTLRKLCFTLKCSEGYTHEDIFNLSKELPEVTEDNYTMLNNIVHWNPIVEATKVLHRFIELADAQQEKIQDPEMQKMIEVAFEEIKEQCEVGLTPRQKS